MVRREGGVMEGVCESGLGGDATGGTGGEGAAGDSQVQTAIQVPFVEVAVEEAGVKGIASTDGIDDFDRENGAAGNLVLTPR
jgi:hypothetical protein